MKTWRKARESSKLKQKTKWAKQELDLGKSIKPTKREKLMELSLLES